MRSPLNPLLVLIVAAGPAVPQAPPDTTARVVGRAISARNGAPLSGVMVAVPQAKAFAVSDATGAFALAGLPAGTQPLRVLYRDELLNERPVNLRAGKTLRLEVLLDVDAALDLAPIVVEARSLRAAHTLAGFYDRRRFGFGRFYTFEDLEMRRGASLRTLLGEAGVQVQCGYWSCVAFGGGAARRCAMPVYRDGVPFPIMEELDFMRVDELAAVEVYKHGIEVPVAFQRAFDGGCGAILIWSRG
jgi:Carboxypeptidase regulatory-like domain